MKAEDGENDTQFFQVFNCPFAFFFSVLNDDCGGLVAFALAGDTRTPSLGTLLVYFPSFFLSFFLCSLSFLLSYYSFFFWFTIG